MDKIINDFIKYAKIHWECTLNGDYKKGNKAADKLFEIQKELEHDEMLLHSVVDILIKSDIPNVVIWIGGIALDNNYRRDDIKGSLLKLLEDGSIGILRIDIKMILEMKFGMKFWD